MKLTTTQMLRLFDALLGLKGAPTMGMQNGRSVMLFEPYDVGAKFTWNAAKDLSVLRPHYDAYIAQMTALQAKLRALAVRKKATNDDQKDALAQIAEETQRLNDEIARLSAEEIEVEGMLKLPATGLNLKTATRRVPPTLVEGLMLLIDGNPEFDD